MKNFIKLLPLFFMALFLSFASCDYLAKTTGANEPDSTAVISVTDRVDAFVVEKATNEIEKTYYALPIETYRLILERIGSNATMNEIVAEYNRNQSYWIGVEISSKVKEIEIESPGDIESITVTPNLKDPAVKVVPDNGTAK